MLARHVDLDAPGAARCRQTERNLRLNIVARAGVLLATLAGLGIAIWAFGSAGFANVAEAAARVGPIGFILFCVYSLAIFAPLGGAWLAAARGEGAGRIGRFAWARMLREAVADLLPFSQVGGIVVGTRSLTLAGIPTARVYASLVVDMTTEMASQLIFTLFGLSMIATLLISGPHAEALRPLILGGTASMVGLMMVFFIASCFSSSARRRAIFDSF